MNATLPTSVTGLCPSQAALKPPADSSGATLEPSPLIGETPDSPASSYGEMPPLESPEDSDEMEEEEIETQGAFCAVTPTPKGEGLKTSPRHRLGGVRVPTVEATMGSRSKFLLLLLAHP